MPAFRARARERERVRERVRVRLKGPFVHVHVNGLSSSRAQLLYFRVRLWDTLTQPDNIAFHA